MRLPRHRVRLPSEYVSPAVSVEVDPHKLLQELVANLDVDTLHHVGNEVALRSSAGTSRPGWRDPPTNGTIALSEDVVNLSADSPLLEMSRWRLVIRIAALNAESVPYSNAQFRESSSLAL